MMETSIQRIIAGLLDLKDKITLLLNDYSKIKRTIFQHDGFIRMSGDYDYCPLPTEAISLQNQIFVLFNLRFDLIDALLVDSTKDHKRTIKDNREDISDYILQNRGTHLGNIKDAVFYLNQRFEKVIQVLNLLFPSSDPRPIIIPDSNALYLNTDIEEWYFEGFDKFTIILTPSVLKDLDRHKIEHRNEAVRKKAIKLINKIKNYRGRGSLIKGVPIISGRIDLKSIAVEPDFSKALKWLDPENDDDRLIAEAFDIIRANCNHPGYIVTADINLQNKCEMSELPFIEPPVPAQKLKK